MLGSAVFHMAGIDLGVASGISGIKEEGADPGNMFDILDAGLNLLPGNWDWITKDLRSSHGQ